MTEATDLITDNNKLAYKGEVNNQVDWCLVNTLSLNVADHTPVLIHGVVLRRCPVSGTWEFMC